MPRVAAKGKQAPASTTPTEPAPAFVEEPNLLSGTDDWFVSLEESTDTIKAVFYGREGSGKTTAAARMTNVRPTGKVLFINAEGGLKKIPLRKRGVDVSRVVSWPPPGVKITHKGLDEIHRRIAADLEQDPDSWIGVVMDSATEVHQAILDTVQKKRIAGIRRQGKEADDDFVDISDYGTMSKLFRDILRKFRDLPCHVVITALERRDVDKDTGKPQYGPAVTPGLQADLLGYVDMVLMFKSEEDGKPYRALTRANSRYRAKDRFDVLPKTLAEPMFDRLVAYLDGDLIEDTDQEQASLKTTEKAGSADAEETEDGTDEESAKSED